MDNDHITKVDFMDTAILNTNKLISEKIMNLRSRQCSVSQTGHVNFKLTLPIPAHSASNVDARIT